LGLRETLAQSFSYFGVFRVFWHLCVRLGLKTCLPKSTPKVPVVVIFWGSAGPPKNRLFYRRVMMRDENFFLRDENFFCAMKIFSAR
jgi:hypothetical protein